MASNSSTGNQRPYSESSYNVLTASPRHSSSLTNSATSQDSVPSVLCDPEETSEAENHSWAVYPFQTPTTRARENEEMAIMRLRATDVAIALGRIPTGFYATVQHTGREWRTDCRPVSVRDDVVEWVGPIPIPSELSATVCIEIYASFEYQPMLGDGEPLRKLTLSVEQLLNCGASDLLFTFRPQDDIVASPCSSILVTVKQWTHGSSDPLASSVLDPCYSTTKSQVQLQLQDATNQGHRALSCYRKYEKKQDLECSLEHFERALNKCPIGHPCRAVAQSNMARAKLIHCMVTDINIPLDVPLELCRDALTTLPVGHPDRLSTLIQLATVHLARFAKRRVGIDVVQAHVLLHDAMATASAESHEKRAAIFLHNVHAEARRNLAEADNQLSASPKSQSGLTEDPLVLDTRLLQCLDQPDHLASLQQAISRLEAFVSSASVLDRRFAAALGNLGIVLFKRFGHLGKLSDLEQAISRFTDVVYMIHGGHPSKPYLLGNLGYSYFTRFERIGELGDLERAIACQRDAHDLLPNGHPHKHVLLDNLTSSLKARFRFSGGLDHLEQAILRLQDAIDLTPDAAPIKFTRLMNLSECLITRFYRVGELHDLEQTISRLKHAVSLAPDTHPGKPCCLDALGTSIRQRFVRLGDMDDLEQAISRQKDAVGLTPDSHPHKHMHIINLATSLEIRFNRLGETNDLDQMILRFRDAVNLIPDDHSDKPTSLRDLGNALRTRFERLGRLNDLEQAISAYDHAIDLPLDGADKSCYLNMLGTLRRARFEHLNKLDDLEQAVFRHKAAVDLTPDDHPRKLDHLHDLGASLSIRFDHLGEINDVDQAILRFRNVVDSTPDGDSEKPNRLNIFGNTLHSRFRQFGDFSDLEQAILMMKHAVDLCPEGHLHKPRCLNDLGSAFITRFQHLGEARDLEKAIPRLQDAVDLTPEGHPARSIHLSNLGISFADRFQRSGDLSDLEQAIVFQQHAIDAADDSTRPHNLITFGDILLTRFKCLGEPSDLEKAISTLEDAVNLTPEGHPDKPRFLNRLGESLRVRFDRSGDLKDLEEAISKQKAATDATPDSNPYKSSRLENLASSFRARFKHLGQPNDLEHAMSLFSQAACASVGSTTARFRASQEWILSARTLSHPSLLHAYSISLSLLPQLAWIGHPISRRYHELVQGANVVREAAAAALDAGHPETAVEWLEQGRSTVWGELFQLRAPYDELSSAHPTHARRLQELSVALEHASIDHEKFLSMLSAEQGRRGENRATDRLEEQADRHRILAIERDKLLQEIRGFQGFERFLLHREYSQLRASAHSGPVVMLNAAETRCDALIVIADKENAIHVPLPRFNIKRCENLQNTMDRLLGPSRLIVPCGHGERAGKPVLRQGFDWETVLSALWEEVVRPVLDVLGLSTPGHLSRIFWCPTGPFAFLPIHAAGQYGTQYSQPGHHISDFVISSYVPTLSILAPPTQDTTPGDVRVLTVPQPPSDGQPPLPGVRTELEYIRTVIQNARAHITPLESSTGTVEEVLALMKDADWVHFACHGVQDDEHPSNSGLCLAHQRRLKLSDMSSLSRPRGGLAFLSACQTAMGDKTLSDEAVHVAAGMLFAGYGSVIGTMWSISDRVAPEVAKDVYEALFQDGTTTPDYRGAARALYHAVGQLRDRGASFVEWVPFIHVGF